MENPYQSPEAPLQPPIAAPPADPFQRPPGLVRHVRVVAILMIIQGVLETLGGLVLIAMGLVMPWLMTQQGQNMPVAPGQPPAETFFWILTFVYGGMGIVVLAVAALHVVAGLRNYRFRSRTLGIVAMASGVLSLFMCYCLPTAVAIGVYGMIVYLNHEVAEAFRMGEAGSSASDILAAFGRRGPGRFT